VIMQQLARYVLAVPMALRKLPFAWLLLLGGCSGGGDPSAPTPAPPLAEAGAAGSAEVSCTNDPRVDAFSKGVSRAGPSGFRIELNSADPGPPAIGDNTWSVTVRDAAGEPVVGAQLTPTARMPDHGHMSPTTPEAEVTDADGRTTITGFNLFMAGVWRIDLQITEAGAQMPADSVSFAFCIEG
jgi:hypothetical protein